VLGLKRPGAGEFSHKGLPVDIVKILEELRRERAQIEEAIMTLERLVEGRGRRRGRPPTWLAEARKRNKDTGGTVEGGDSDEEMEEEEQAIRG
jgi:hypothetical protein